MISVFLILQMQTVVAATPPSTAGCRIVVLDLVGKNISAAEKDLPSLLTESVAQEVSGVSGCQVVTQSDVAQMMDFEATRQTCGAESESCLAEIGSALGADRIVAGSVGKLGTDFVLTARLLNVASGTVEQRGEQVVPGAPEHLRVAAKNLGRQLFGAAPLAVAAPAPTPTATTTHDSSPWVWVGAGVGAVGALTAIGGGVVLILADGALGDPTTTDKGAQLATGQVAAAVGAGGVLVTAGGLIAALLASPESP